MDEPEGLPEETWEPEGRLDAEAEGLPETEPEGLLETEAETEPEGLMEEEPEAEIRCEEGAPEMEALPDA